MTVGGPRSISSNVPAHLLRPLIWEWIGLREHSVDDYTWNGQKCGSARTFLAELSGVNVRTIRSILKGEQETVEFRTADRLLMAMDMPEAWHRELAEFRWGLEVVA